MELKALRDQWEQGYTPVVAFVSADIDTIHIVLQSVKNDSYTLHRYFISVRGKWHVSVDEAEKSLLEIVKLLPQALNNDLVKMKIPD